MMETQESWYGRFLSTDSEKENGERCFGLICITANCLRMK